MVLYSIQHMNNVVLLQSVKKKCSRVTVPIHSPCLIPNDFYLWCTMKDEVHKIHTQIFDISHKPHVNFNRSEWCMQWVWHLQHLTQSRWDALMRVFWDFLSRLTASTGNMWLPHSFLLTAQDFSNFTCCWFVSS